MQISDTLAFLLGGWELRRTIEDHCSGTSGLFEGSATILEAELMRSSAVGNRAGYEEAGELRFGTCVTRASRSLVYARLDRAAVMLHFADGRPFVDLDLRGGEWRSVHDCGEDRYEIATTACSQGVMEERWRVRGPGKDYDAVTTMTRVE